MDYSKRPADQSRRFTGMAVVGVLHLAVGYLAVSGVGQQIIEVIKPTETKVIEEVKLPPPPPEIVTPPPPKLEAPPPPYIPPPLVEIAAPPPPPTVITAQASPTPPPVTDYRPPPPPGPPAPPAPPAPRSMSIGVVCPGMVRPEMPARALKDGVSGSVRARITIKAGKVVNVEIVSAKPRGYFEAAVRAAVYQYSCSTQGDQEVVAEQPFEFTAEE
jgi:protein TonB